LVILAGLSIIEFNFSSKNLKTAIICFIDDSTEKTKGCFQVELAERIFEQQRGLMYRNSLDKDKGMLFVFNKEANYPFWMKNTLIPLDIIWIDRNSKVVFIKENAKPCTSQDCEIINPNQKSQYALEISGGITKELGLDIGDYIDISFL